MQISGRGGAVRPAFIETVTCYRAWIGSIAFLKSVGGQMPVLGWSVSVIRQSDWLSAQLRATKSGTLYASVKITTPSGAVVTLSGADVSDVMFAGYGPAQWLDPTHPRPKGPLEQVSYTCSAIYVDNAWVVSPTYNWWRLNA